MRRLTTLAIALVVRHIEANFRGRLNVTTIGDGLGSGSHEKAQPRAGASPLRRLLDAMTGATGPCPRCGARGFRQGAYACESCGWGRTRTLESWVPSGWYQDPANPERARYWDGFQHNWAGTARKDKPGQPIPTAPPSDSPSIAGQAWHAAMGIPAPGSVATTSAAKQRETPERRSASRVWLAFSRRSSRVP